MRFPVRKAVLSGVICMGLAQLVRPDTQNPPVDQARSLWNDRAVDTRVAGILRRACADCHSHETAWPWYSKVSPVSWLLERHVKNGRAKLNFSDWAGASQDQLEEIYDSVAKGKMPMPGYLLLHPQARLSQTDRDILQAWTDGKMAKSESR
jgi:Haem-binding domain